MGMLAAPLRGCRSAFFWPFTFQHGDEFLLFVEPPQKWLVDMNRHRNDAHQRVRHRISYSTVTMVFDKQLAIFRNRTTILGPVKMLSSPPYCWACSSSMRVTMWPRKGYYTKVRQQDASAHFCEARSPGFAGPGEEQSAGKDRGPYSFLWLSSLGLPARCPFSPLFWSGGFPY